MNTASASTLPPAPPLPSVAADYFDGQHAQAHPVRLLCVNGQLLIRGSDLQLSVPLKGLRWPERQRHGPRLMELPGGGQLVAHDGPAWDAWQRQVGPGSWVVGLQQSWRAVAAALLALLLLGWLAYAQGLPLLSRGLLALLPASVDAQVGQAALEAMDRQMLAPSALRLARQAQLRERFAGAVQRAAGSAAAPPYALHWRRSHDGRQPGPNAFALPGGVIVVTDELVQLLDGHDDTLLGVLGHELGHVQQRHGMRLLTQTGLLALAAGVALGDFSSVLASAPVLLGQVAYTRDFEREADDAAIALLQANGLSPLAMLPLFERLATRTQAGTPGQTDSDGWWGIALATHPADAERIARFQAAAAAGSGTPAK